MEIHALNCLFSNINYSATGAGVSATTQESAFTQQESALGHSALQQESAFWQQLSAFWQHFSTHSVFGQPSAAPSVLAAFLQQPIAQKATAAINKIFFITLNLFRSFIHFKSFKDSKSIATLRPLQTISVQK